MAPKKIAAGNWKMNGVKTSLSELDQLAAGEGCDVLICPPFTLIALAAGRAGAVQIGGQDCHANASGAHTGDISAPMLKDAGASFVITGHSERRADHGESDAIIAAKTLAGAIEDCGVAARAGFAGSRAILADAFAKGVGVAADPKEAAHWARLARDLPELRKDQRDLIAGLGE